MLLHFAFLCRDLLLRTNISERGSRKAAPGSMPVTAEVRLPHNERPPFPTRRGAKGAATLNEPSQLLLHGPVVCARRSTYPRSRYHPIRGTLTRVFACHIHCRTGLVLGFSISGPSRTDLCKRPSAACESNVGAPELAFPNHLSITNLRKTLSSLSSHATYRFTQLSRAT